MTKLEQYQNYLRTSYEAWMQIMIKCERKHFIGLSDEDLHTYKDLYYKRNVAEMWVGLLRK